tara:strand:+ start:6806 stop:7351 length:546 start_codon:yes stop_codon:yes gene_type:complete
MNSNYKNLRKTFIAILAIFLINLTTGQTKEDLKVISAAQETKTTYIKNNPELADLILNAYAYVIFPELKEGTYAKEGVAGQGALYSNGKVIGIVQVTQPDAGFDLEDKSFSQLMLFENERQFERLNKGDLKLVTDMHGVMMEKGQTKSFQFRDGMTVITLPHNKAQIDISVEGQSFSLTKF